MDDPKRLIAQQFNKRSEHKSVNSVKINLYKGYEVESVALAMNSLVEFGDLRFPDCFMVADSYLTTHLRRNSTQLSKDESDFFLTVFFDLVYEVRLAINQYFANQDIYLIADMPDGSYQTETLARKNAESMSVHGAEAVKIEASQSEHFKIIEQLSANGICVIAHIGYTPQTGQNRIYGDTYEEALQIFSMARRARDCGASALVIERVSELTNTLLCVNQKDSIPIYSVFSGISQYGGQSLNVWDSVIRPPFKAKYFPPTAAIEDSEFPNLYTPKVISEKFGDLMRLTLTNQFPLSPKSTLSAFNAEKLMAIDPWRNQ